MVHFDPRHPRDEVSLKGKSRASLEAAFNEAKILHEESVLGGDMHIVPLFWDFVRDSTACFVCKVSVERAKKQHILLCDACGNPFHIKCLNSCSVPQGLWYCVVCQERQAHRKMILHQLQSAEVAGGQQAEESVVSLRDMALFLNVS